MQLPSLNALRAVEAIGRHRSLTQAARALGVTPGALSHQLRALEERLGLALFVRSERGLVPTAAGQRLLPALTDAFQRIADAIADATAREQSTLTVTCGLAFAAKWLVPRLVEWSSLHSDLEVRLVTTSRLVDFDREDIDLGIRFGRGRWPELRSELVVTQMLFPVCTPDLARQLRSPADLAHVPLIDDARSLFGWDQWLAQMGHDRGNRVRRSFPDASLAVEAALASHGVLLAWPLIVEDALTSGRLVKPFPDTLDAGLGYWIVSTPARWRRRNVQRFRSWLSSVVSPAA